MAWPCPCRGRRPETGDPAAKLAHPWHRVAAGDGGLGTVKHAPDARTQAELLAAEGVPMRGVA
jgi:alkylated DNA nucleotide flippase Atl1